MKPIVAVVGRPNVGKSTFFNRITRTRDALVDDRPGVTRDRLYRDAHWDDTDFILIDTGGFLEQDDDIFAAHIREQIHHAVMDADAVLLMFDGKNGLSPFDRDMHEMLRNVQKPIFHVVNKIDGIEQEIHLTDFYELGLRDLYPISSEHGYGVGDLMDDLVAALPPGEETDRDDHLIRVAVVGRPNVGKSSLINQILGKNRHVVSDMPGTTRDAVDSLVTHDGKQYCLVDTAGIRRKGKVREKLEKFSVIKALKSLDRCDVALVVMDASEGVTEQDATIAGYAESRGCGCILVLNKWDLVEKDAHIMRRFKDRLREEVRFLGYAPSVTISALTGQRVHRLFGMVDEVYQQYARRISTGEINRIITRATERNEPPLHKGKRLKFYYSTQVSEKPPTFVGFVNFPDAVHFSYQRYLINQIREAAGLDKTPLRLLLRQRTGHIDFSTRKKKPDEGTKRRKKRR